jgi:NADH:ubiquinone oxidoreductase subunit 6 (subunit J)
MMTILLIVLIVMMLSGWGYGRSSGGRYGNPMGVVGVILVIVLVVLLLGGHLS